MIFLSSTLVYASQITNNDFKVYEDKRHKFAFWYPKNWQSAPTSDTRTRINIISDNGLGEDDCNVTVVESKIFKNQKKYVKGMVANTDKVERFLKKQNPSYRLVKSGQSYLSNRQAFYTVATMIFRSFGVEIPIKVIQVSTVNQGMQYTITCRTSPENFESMLPLFKVIMVGFRIKDF